MFSAPGSDGQQKRAHLCQTQGGLCSTLPVSLPNTTHSTVKTLVLLRESEFDINKDEDRVLGRAINMLWEGNERPR